MWRADDGRRKRERREERHTERANGEPTSTPRCRCRACPQARERKLQWRSAPPLLLRSSSSSSGYPRQRQRKPRRRSGGGRGKDIAAAA
ncbi:unnamed protein product [Trichogramma brassicae]|uniref:Uncharacterized protein n=1 Tax=Trichogramma brassicae TaxID=86971 RepID=A0A6H5HZ03_9HYME|nr:unnamed protein product [Trichogramma brassicae]